MVANVVGHAVLGIDAAWTSHHPSGVGLIYRDESAWRCVALASSYRQFIGAASEQVREHGWPGALALLEASRRRLPSQVKVAVVAVDMPLAKSPIVGRRAADRAVSTEYGAKGCAVHSPTPARPGPLAESIRSDFERAGFPLASAGDLTGSAPRLVEVYPHPAVMALCGADYRVTYKVSRARRYWPGKDPDERVALLCAQWRTIVDALSRQVADVDMPMPPVLPRTGLKAFEDTLDALVCAWVGARYLEGHARAFGDDDAAIWVPTQSRR